MCYNVQEYIEIAKTIKKLRQEKSVVQRFKKHQKKTQQNIDEIIEANVNKLNKHRQLLLSNRNDYFTGVAFVSFEKIWEAEYFVQKFHVGRLQWFLRRCNYKYKYRDHRVGVRQAPEPGEILWVNMNYTFR